MLHFLRPNPDCRKHHIKILHFSTTRERALAFIVRLFKTLSSFAAPLSPNFNRTIINLQSTQTTIRLSENIQAKYSKRKVALVVFYNLQTCFLKEFG